MYSFLEVQPRVRGPADGLSLVVVFRLVAVAAMFGLLGACGGGGSGSAPTPPPPAPSPSGPLDAVMSVPDPVGYDADRLAAFNRLNEIRLSAGLGMLAQNRLMDQAAQAHADWEISNDVFGHVEQAGTIGFTGAHWYDRDEALGYTAVAGGEVAASGAASVNAVNLLANLAYHRAIVLAIEPVDVGIGRSGQTASNVSQPVVVDIAVPGKDVARGFGQLAQTSTGGIVIWPADKAVGVQTNMGDEVPNPVAGSNVLALGTPVSVTVSSAEILSVTSFSLMNMSKNEAVLTRLLTKSSDPNGLVPASYFAAIPLAALDSNATFAVDFEGSVLDPYTNVTTPLSRAWTFSTGSD
jgi:hypothetical protein